ncbi:hypothetical protein GCM10027429_29370 [Marivirga atlantica]|jgi:hypothetical protein|uniref:Uncharacterized protein n=1 Tax=Marivirga atlantica TaxID=1548457 RepID=A0A937AGV2_9BACT|nr:hypothetical protein [Marivirga atlantica]MBL0766516.1 hypothetical protein [Marivirga atlantica]
MKEKYLNDIKEIKEMMNKSSRFVSLSGPSGIVAGIIALIGAFAAHQLIFKETTILGFDRIFLSEEQLINLVLIGVVTLVTSILLIILLTTRETKKRNQPIWDQQTKRILINLAIPLFTGGFICLILLLQGFAGLLLPFTLVFYGLALVNVSKYTLHEMLSLGLIECFLGLLALVLIEYSLIIWSVGFGLVNIIYGFVVKTKYK